MKYFSTVICTLLLFGCASEPKSSINLDDAYEEVIESLDEKVERIKEQRDPIFG